MQGLADNQLWGDYTHKDSRGVLHSMAMVQGVHELSTEHPNLKPLLKDVDEFVAKLGRVKMPPDLLREKGRKDRKRGPLVTNAYLWAYKVGSTPKMHVDTAVYHARVCVKLIADGTCEASGIQLYYRGY